MLIFVYKKIFKNKKEQQSRKLDSSPFTVAIKERFRCEANFSYLVKKERGRYLEPPFVLRD